MEILIFASKQTGNACKIVIHDKKVLFNLGQQLTKWPWFALPQS